MTKNEAQDSPGQALGRNERCHCGSGTKYKQCCLAADEAKVLEQQAKQAEADAKEAAAAPDQAEAEPQEQHRKTQRPVSHQPWKRDSKSATSTQKRTLPRKVGGGS